jgi:hypothetical protein
VLLQQSDFAAWPHWSFAQSSTEWKYLKSNHFSSASQQAVTFHR